MPAPRQVTVSDDLALPYASWLRYDEFAVGLPESCLAQPYRAWATLARRRSSLAAMRRASAAVRPLFLYEQHALTAVLASLLIEQSPRIGALRRLTLTQKDAHHGVRNLLF